MQIVTNRPRSTPKIKTIVSLSCLIGAETLVAYQVLEWSCWPRCSRGHAGPKVDGPSLFHIAKQVPLRTPVSGLERARYRRQKAIVRAIASGLGSRPSAALEASPSPLLKRSDPSRQTEALKLHILPSCLKAGHQRER
jgi:hypothetical protein